MSFAAAGALRLKFESFGSEDHPPLLLISGLGAQMLQWPATMCRDLAARGLRVIRFDNRDCGLSSRMDHLGTVDLQKSAAAWRRGNPLPPPYSLEEMADDAVALMDALNLGKVHLCGISVGGMVAQNAALRHPLRFLSLTSIMSAPGGKNLPVATKIALSSFKDSMPEDFTAYAAQTLELRRALAGPGFPIDETHELEVAAEQWRRGIYPAGTARQLAAFFAYGCRRQELASLRLPTLIMHGDRDPLVPLAAGVRTYQAIPQARLVVFTGMGHDLPRKLWPHLSPAIATQARSMPFI